MKKLFLVMALGLSSSVFASDVNCSSGTVSVTGSASEIVINIGSTELVGKTSNLDAEPVTIDKVSGDFFKAELILDDEDSSITIISDRNTKEYPLDCQ